MNTSIKVLLLMALALPSQAAQNNAATGSAKIAVLPPVIKVEGTRKENDKASQDKFNPAESVKRIMPRLINEAKKKNWPLDILSAEEAQEGYLAVIGPAQAEKDEVKFNQLKPIAEKLGVRYVVRFTIIELTSYRKTNVFVPTAAARAGITLYVYDHDTNQYVWQIEKSTESAAGDLTANGSLSQRQDQALLNSVSRALEPFAKGERKNIGRPKNDLIANVQKVLADGKSVLIDVGSDKNVSEGDIFNSIESDASIKVTKVLSNGSIAEVIKGSPKDKETFKSAE